MTKESFDTYYNIYTANGFKALRCKGYSYLNPEKDYKKAKAPFDTGFTSENYPGLSLQECTAWISNDGWLGWVIPEGYVALDIEDSWIIGLLENMFKKHSINPGVHKTNNGRHFLFRIPKEVKISGDSKGSCQLGFNVTYRIGGKNYLILAPTSKREWLKWIELKDLSLLPKKLMPFARNDKLQVMHVLSYKIGDSKLKDEFGTYKDLIAYMAFLAERGFTDEEIHNGFRMLFREKYDANKCDCYLQRTRERIASGEPLYKTGTLVKRVKELGLNEIKALIDRLVKFEYGEDRFNIKRDMEEKFNPLVEARNFISGRHFIFIYKQIREYKDGYYQVINGRFLLQQIAEQLYNERDNSRLAKSKEVLETVKNILTPKMTEIDLNADPGIINCKNGLLDIKTMTLLLHTPERIDLYQINASYNPEATCPEFMKFLEEVIVDKNFRTDYELIKIIQEFIGYCFYTAIPFHEALIFYGKGSNGKSALINVICNLFHGLVSNVNFEIIGHDRFATADIAGKLLNISSEISMYTQLKDGDIKSIISGDTQRAQRKFESAFDFKPSAKHIISTNNLPSTADISFGYFRRFKVIPFRQTFLTEQELTELSKTDSEEKTKFKAVKPFLEKKLLNELDGIFLWVVQGLKRLLENNSFTYSEQIEEMKEIFKIRSTSVKSFSEKYFIESSTDNLLLQEAHKKYIGYCQECTIPPLSIRKFSETLRNLGYIVERGSKNQVFIKGVKLIDEPF